MQVKICTMMDQNTLLDILVTITVYAMSTCPRTPVGSRAEARHRSDVVAEGARQLPTGKEWTGANGILTNKICNTRLV
ncbi:hypothetical protein ACERII_11340 [Evansella sp. AB-rgal1]|uniref:hypothetical protein n=1 Tax=Evansella sp. AB-rgal1 TaxID=3242696 RepID=UPI00359D0287